MTIWTLFSLEIKSYFSMLTINQTFCWVAFSLFSIINTQFSIPSKIMDVFFQRFFISLLKSIVFHTSDYLWCRFNRPVPSRTGGRCKTSNKRYTKNEIYVKRILEDNERFFSRWITKKYIQFVHLTYFQIKLFISNFVFGAKWKNVVKLIISCGLRV